jgi:predicted acylesterase/phospholipase RssA
MKFSIYRQIFSFVERGGLYAGNAFVEWLTEKLDQNGRNLGGATLAEFHERTAKDLTVVASDTTVGKILVLNHRTAPDCPVVYAVRMSMSIPFIWQEVRWQKEWGLFRGEDISDHAVVDGGVLSNFPIELLISRNRDVISMMGPHDDVFAVGMLIDETRSVQGLAEAIKREQAKDEGFHFPIDVKSLATTKRVTRLIDTMMRGHDKLVIDAYADGVARLPAKGYGTTDFDLSEERAQALINAGRDAMRQFLDHLTTFLQQQYPDKLRKKPLANVDASTPQA